MTPFCCPRCAALVPSVTEAEQQDADRRARLRFGPRYLRRTVYVCGDCAATLGDQMPLLEVSA